MSKGNAGILAALAHGYTADAAGIIYKPDKTVQKEYTAADGYKMFTPPASVSPVVIKSHRFIAAFYLGKEALAQECIRHLDGDKTNNCIDNILPGSHTDNRMDIPKELRVASAKVAAREGGAVTRERNRILSDEDVAAIRRLYRNKTHTQKALASMFGLRSQGNVSRLCSGNTWAHIQE